MILLENSISHTNFILCPCNFPSHRIKLFLSERFWIETFINHIADKMIKVLTESLKKGMSYSLLIAEQLLKLQPQMFRIRIIFVILAWKRSI